MGVALDVVWLGTGLDNEGRALPQCGLYETVHDLVGVIDELGIGTPASAARYVKTPTF